MTLFLETKRLLIKAPCIDDLNNLYQLQSDPAVMQYVGHGTPRTLAEVRGGLEKAIEHYVKHGFSLGSIFDKESGVFMGRAGLLHFAYNDQQSDIEFGYALQKKYWGKGYATEISQACIKWAFQHLPVKKLVAVIQPGNERSRHVLEKLGLHYVGRDLYHGVEVARYEINKNLIDYSQIQVLPAPVADYPIFQKLANYYAYDISEFFSHTPGWEMPDSGIYEPFDFIKYWQDPDTFPFLIRYRNELVGFIIIDKKGTDIRTDYNMAQFFILRKFHQLGIGRYVVQNCFDQFFGTWEVMVMPRNEGAYRFWRSVIKAYTEGTYQEMTKVFTHSHGEPRNIFRFKTGEKPKG